MNEVENTNELVPIERREMFGFEGKEIKIIIFDNEPWFSGKMAEYIEREAAIRKINGEFPDAHYPSWYAAPLEEVPVADVVEVVRKPVVGYEGYYEVDQFGRVFSLDRVISVDDNGRKYDKSLSSKQMKQSMHDKGYKTVSLTRDGKTKMRFVHRLVAEAFIPNPDNLPMVNHKDEDKANNFI